jgi:hypothetical protein
MQCVTAAAALVVAVANSPAPRAASAEREHGCRPAAAARTPWWPRAAAYSKQGSWTRHANGSKARCGSSPGTRAPTTRSACCTSGATISPPPPAAYERAVDADPALAEAHDRLGFVFGGWVRRPTRSRSSDKPRRSSPTFSTRTTTWAPRSGGRTTRPGRARRSSGRSPWSPDHAEARYYLGPGPGAGRRARGGGGRAAPGRAAGSGPRGRAHTAGGDAAAVGRRRRRDRRAVESARAVARDHRRLHQPRPGADAEGRSGGGREGRSPVSSSASRTTRRRGSTSAAP